MKVDFQSIRILLVNWLQVNTFTNKICCSAMLPLALHLQRTVDVIVFWCNNWNCIFTKKTRKCFQAPYQLLQLFGFGIQSSSSQKSTKKHVLLTAAYPHKCTRTRASWQQVDKTCVQTWSPASKQTCFFYKKKYAGIHCTAVPLHKTAPKQFRA